MRTQLINFTNAFSGSYGQVFFSVNKLFALFLLAASFLDPLSGTSGLIAVLVTILLAKALGLNPVYIQNGSYSFNSLLTGLALGAYFKFTGNFVAILLIASLFTLLVTVCLSAITSRHQLPFLSLPFIISIWIIFLNTRSFNPGLLQLRSANELNGCWGDAFSGFTF